MIRKRHANTRSSAVGGWTIAEIVRLFDFDRATVGKILANTQHAEGARNSKIYTGRQILNAWLTYNQTDRKNVEAERARLLFHQANLAALDEEEKRGNLIPRGKLSQIHSNIAGAIRRVIISSKLSKCEKASIIAELKELGNQGFDG